MQLEKRIREVVPAAACSAILLWQLFLPGFIGLANNRDFAKVMGRLCIGRPDVLSSYYAYFHPGYDRAQRYCWDSHIPASELAPARAASWIEQRFGDPAHFDIRWLGAVHAILFLIAWWILLRALRPLSATAWWIAMAAALWIFLDVSYISYFNTFYTDATAILGAMLMLSSALWMAAEKPGTLPTICFFSGALLFLTSKAQHAATVPLLVGFLIAARWRRGRALTAICAIAMLAGAAWVILLTPDSYKAQPRFTLVFSKILPSSPAPARDVLALGLSESDLPLIGQHAFLPYSPAFDPAWLDAFSRRCTYQKVLLFWLRHPVRALTAIRADLDNEAWRRRPVDFSNYQPEAGKPAGARTDRFGSWSALNERISRAVPMLVVAWYAFILFFAARGSGLRVALLAALLGATEFLIATLADARETDRHLLLFHLFTDWTVFLALVYFLNSRSSASLRG